jgi:hypothetical protein
MLVNVFPYERMEKLDCGKSQHPADKFAARINTRRPLLAIGSAPLVKPAGAFDDFCGRGEPG